LQQAFATGAGTYLGDHPLDYRRTDCQQAVIGWGRPGSQWTSHLLQTFGFLVLRFWPSGTTCAP